MNTKEAILSYSEQRGAYSISADVNFRNRIECYERFYTKEQLDYLFNHNLLEKYKKCGAFWESTCYEYYQFTPKGKRLRIWYTTPFWTWVKIYILKTWWWTDKWQKLMIIFGHHYSWQDYEE